MRSKTCIVTILTALLFMGCQPAGESANKPTNANSASSNAKWDAYVDQFLKDYFAANPSFAVNQGKHEYDGKFPDWSNEGISKEIARLKSEREKASTFKDADLDDRQRFERDYLIAQIDSDLFWSETADLPHRNPNSYAGALDPGIYVTREYAPLETRIKAYTTYAKNVPAALMQIKGTLKTPLAKDLVKIARQTIGGLSGFYSGDVLKVFGSVNDEAAQKEFKEANDAAIKAVKDLMPGLPNRKNPARMILRSDPRNSS